MTEWEALMRVAIAAGLGASIGLERELRGKAAGLRTVALVALGACLFMVTGILVTQDVPGDSGIIQIDSTRIMAYTISGIGFLGGAIVFRREDRAEGVTTAAAVWTSTGIGLAVGSGHYILAAGATVMILITLYTVSRVESYIGLKNRLVDDEEE
jgi:putative Mg2+ transporter-C (MgtC) family protein